MNWRTDIPPRGVRLVTLRHLEGLTQRDVADRLGVTAGFVSQLEKETKPMPVDLAMRVCDEYDLPESFFTVPPDVAEIGVLTFPKSAKASVRDENRVTALFGEASRLFRLASNASRYHPTSLATLTEEPEEDAAAQLRSQLGLDCAQPLANATRALERLGVGVVHTLDPLEPARRDHDGICRPSKFDDRPLVATVGDQPPAVKRMTLLHELGHLVYDTTLTAPIRGRRALEERRAFRFAGAMLIPAAVVRERITNTLTLHGYLRVKADYGITVSALIQRAADLGVITTQRARSLYIQHSSLGWRHGEPVVVADEQPLLLRQAALRGIGTTSTEIAHATGVPEALIGHWTGLDPAPRRLAEVVPLSSAQRSSRARA